MPLQNRVDPAGRIVRNPARGLFMGNRGGPLHDANQDIIRTRKTKAWIICVTEFKNRRRKLMQPGRYTELFFLDEATALSAGHRPCFECRRDDALAFSNALARAKGVDRLKAPQIDDMLEQNRSRPAIPAPRLIDAQGIAVLPSGTMVSAGEHSFLVYCGQLLRWSFSGYQAAMTQGKMYGQTFHLMTPAATLLALQQGYRPVLHPSAIG